MKETAQKKIQKPTIQDVARRADVSAGTVSHVMNGTAPISDQTKRRVRQAISELGYNRNENARALRTADSKIIGVVLQDISSEFYAQCTAGILQHAQEAGYAVLTVDAHFSPSLLCSGVKALVSRRVNGLIFVGGWHDEACYESAADEGIPIVFGDRAVANYPCVQFNNRDTMRKLVRALYRQGYRRFSYIGEQLGFQENLEQRFGGVCDAVRELGIPGGHFQAILASDLHDRKLQHSFSYFREHSELFCAPEEPHVILTSNDLIALGAIYAIQRCGKRVPEDVAVVGFDNISVAAHSMPSITTVVQDPYLLGSKCFELLMKRISSPSDTYENQLLEQQIALRESAPLAKEHALMVGLSIYRERTSRREAYEEDQTWEYGPGDQQTGAGKLGHWRNLHG